MKESKFVKDNAEEWKNLENLSNNDHSTADELADGFIKITDDLAYAQTFFGESQSVSYLNKLATQYHQKIYKNKQESVSSIYWLWQYDLPILFYKYRKYFYFSIALFLAFVWIGVESARHDETFVRLILGDSYVDATIEYIKSGNPFGVYGSEPEFIMFLMIAFNNIRVSFYCFGSGILPIVGPLFLCMRNSIMLGAFECFFFKYNLGAKSISVIMLHGTLELWSIIIAVAAGFILSSSILFPKTYPRGYSMRVGLANGLKITIGLMPLFLVAAFIESFVTRHGMQMPATINWSIIGVSSAFLAWYFFIYPNMLMKKIENFPNIETENKNFSKWLSKKYESEK